MAAATPRRLSIVTATALLGVVATTLPAHADTGGSGSLSGTLGSVGQTVGGTVNGLTSFLTVPVPTILGTPRAGSPLTAVAGTFAPLPSLLTYQWSADGVAISGADSAVFTPGNTQAGKHLTVSVTASLAGLLPAVTASLPTGPVQGVFTSPPVAAIVGTPTVGRTLTADVTVPAPLADTLAYQWYADGAPVAGATSASLALTSDLVGAKLTVGVTASKADFASTSVLSAATTSVQNVASALGAAITGTARVGETLTAVASGLDPLRDQLSYQWYADGSPISGATGATLQLGAAQTGAAITVGITASGSGVQPVTALSQATGVVGSLVSLPLVDITGTPKVGRTLTAHTGPLSSGLGLLTYQWYADGRAISGARDNTLVLTGAQRGSRITVRLTATGLGLDDLVRESDPTSVVDPGDITFAGGVLVTGTERVGSTLTADLSGLSSSPSAPYTGQWLRDGSPVPGATGTTYTLTNADAGSQLAYRVTAHLADYTDATTTSPASGAVEGGVLALGTPVLSGAPAVGTPVTAQLPGAPDGTTVTWAWTRDGQQVATGATYTPTAADLERQLVLTATATRPHFDTATVSLTTDAVAAAAFATAPSARVVGTPTVGTPVRVELDPSTPAAQQYLVQWFAGGAPIDGATGTSFTPTAAQVGKALTARVTALRPGYAASSVTTDPTAAVRGVFGTPPAPQVVGTPTVGSTLVASTGDVQPEPGHLAYQWYADGEPIAGATAASFDLTADQAGKLVTVRVTASLPGYVDATGLSAPTGAVQTPATGDLTASVNGTPKVGDVLTAATGVLPDGYDELSYQWLADGDAIDGATARTLRLAADQSGAVITVRVTASGNGVDDLVVTSDPTGATARGDIALVGAVRVTGDEQVGDLLTADLTGLTSTPSAPFTGQWLRDGSPVDGATAPTYRLTDADAGSRLAYRVTATLRGYLDATVTSLQTGLVAGAPTAGSITLPTPSVSGTPAVGALLTAVPGGATNPAGAEVTYTWSRDGAQVGTGSTYTPTAADLGQPLRLTATATLVSYATTTVSTLTGPVGTGHFLTGPTAVITGTAKVGELLTATTLQTLPVADSFTYQWFADSAPISGATGPTLRLGASQKHHRVTVRVTARREGFQDAGDTSAPTAAVATDTAPELSLTSSTATVRRGQPVTLTWSTQDAVLVTASGGSPGWVGLKSDSGSVQVSPTDLGATTYTLTAANGNGTTTSAVTVVVQRPATRLLVAASTGYRFRGHNIVVTTAGLEAGEDYAIRIAGALVARGTASGLGTVSRTVLVPTTTPEGTRPVEVTGSAGDRVGSTTVRVLGAKRLGVRASLATVRPNQRERITVTGLAPGEPVSLTYRSRRVTPANAVADSRGVWSSVFNVGRTRGSQAVKVYGLGTSRNALARFVVR